MPKNLSRFTVGVRVSFLPRAFKRLDEAKKFNTTKTGQERLYGLITGVEIEGQSSIAVIEVDGFAGLQAKIKFGSLKYEDLEPAAPATRQQPETNGVAGLVDYDSDSSSDVRDDDDNNNDANPVENENNQWTDEEVPIDARLVNLSYMQDSQITLTNAAYSSPIQMFMHFLPMDHIARHVIPAIIAKAAILSLGYWKDLTLEEYMLWIGLWTSMLLIPMSDRGKYWSTAPSFLFTTPVNFSRWMTRRRFEMILKAHTLEHPTVINASSDPLVDIRGYLNAYNDNLAASMIPGKTLTIDESMNQWLGKVSRMPNVKKILGKPHPVGQEFKNIADATTNIMLRLDISEKNQDGKEFSNLGAVGGCIVRLTKPWFASGRTIVADSWFGSPAVAAALRKKGLYSIMALKKRKYWPRNVPKDIIDNLPGTYGSHVCKVATIDAVPMFIAALRDRKPQCLISTCSSTIPGSIVSHVVKENNQSRRVEFQRAVVFDDYNAAKGAIHINNNIRDNMFSYHDVIGTNTWQHRSFAFFLAVAEANAFLAWRAFGPENLRNMSQSQFRDRLASELVHKYDPYSTENNAST
ncbi:hypothetical protein O0I10_012680 [Lichtheimia ornata]|uniref:PiggyBac transposable element-derived protein domain-containing protein n=1 Tax=Lichtheimia ornata TaxID=688661 RepID=A0AAD7UQU1_9FUNG|nr:uncharacterized protein O0I10_012680 [Lichtheimia ornata]KAJ8651753.1 hypothetical protein O0I10_012680 [Lichtheimia ornata]